MELNITPQPKQHLAFEAWNHPLIDDVVYGGAAGGGKTWWGSEAIMIDALRWPDTRYFIAREGYENLMATSFVTLTQKVLPHHKLENGKHWHFNGSKKQVEFYNGSTISFIHIENQPSDPLFNRFGSHEYTRGWIDEASESPFKAYDVLKSRVGRWKNKELNIKSKMALTLNPSQGWPYRIFYDPWKKAGRPSDPEHALVSIRGQAQGETIDRLFVFVEAKWNDNEYTAAEYMRNLATINDPVLKARLMEGDWEYSSAADVLFDASSIADLFTSRTKKGEKYITVDVSRNSDLFVIRYWEGWTSFRTEIHDPKIEGIITAPRAADWVRTGIDTYGVPREHVLVDQDGVGGGVIDLLPGCIGFSGASAPFGMVGERANREKYDNLRAQCVYHTSYIVMNRQAADTSLDVAARELLAADLVQFKRREADKLDAKLKVTKKEDIKAALGRSPDCGDTFWMRAYFDLRLREEALGQGGVMSVFIPD